MYVEYVLREGARRGASDAHFKPGPKTGGIYFEINNEALLSKSREKRVAYPRQIAMYLMRELGNRSLVEIGDAPEFSLINPRLVISSREQPANL